MGNDFEVHGNDGKSLSVKYLGMSDIPEYKYINLRMTVTSYHTQLQRVITISKVKAIECINEIDRILRQDISYCELRDLDEKARIGFHDHYRHSKMTMNGWIAVGRESLDFEIETSDTVFKYFRDVLEGFTE